MTRPTKTDASMDVALNAVRMPDGSVLPWALANPRPTPWEMLTSEQQLAELARREKERQ